MMENLKKAVIPIFAGMTLCLMATTTILAAPTLPNDFCQALIAHVPTADVAYQPNPSIDLNPSPIKIPDEINIPITTDIIKFLELDPNKLPTKAFGETNATLGTLTYKDEMLFWDGKPLNDEQPSCSR